MKIKYLVSPPDLMNDCLDVLIRLADNYCIDRFVYIVEVTTPQFLVTFMEKEESYFLPPDFPYIIVSKLTGESIRVAIQAFIDQRDDLYWLKLSHIAASPSLKIEDIDEI